MLPQPTLCVNPCHSCPCLAPGTHQESPTNGTFYQALQIQRKICWSSVVKSTTVKRQPLLLYLMFVIKGNLPATPIIKQVSPRFSTNTLVLFVCSYFILFFFLFITIVILAANRYPSRHKTMFPAGWCGPNLDGLCLTILLLDKHRDISPLEVRSPTSIYDSGARSCRHRKWKSPECQAVQMHGDCSKFASANEINRLLTETNTRPVLQTGAMQMGWWEEDP